MRPINKNKLSGRPPLLYRGIADNFQCACQTVRGKFSIGFDEKATPRDIFGLKESTGPGVNKRILSGRFFFLSNIGCRCYQPPKIILRNFLSVIGRSRFNPTAQLEPRVNHCFWQTNCKAMRLKLDTYPLMLN